MIRRPQLTDEFIESNRQLLPEGIHSFIVKKVEVKMSKSGNEVINLFFQTWDDAGKEYYIWDTLVLSEKMFWKEKHFWESVGLPDMNLKESYHENEFLDKCGKFETFILDDKQYGKKAKVRDYLPYEEDNKTQTNDFTDDELNFGEI